MDKVYMKKVIFIFSYVEDVKTIQCGRVFMSSDKKTKVDIRLLSFWLKVGLFLRVALGDYFGIFQFDVVFLYWISTWQFINKKLVFNILYFINSYSNKFRITAGNCKSQYHFTYHQLYWPGNKKKLLISIICYQITSSYQLILLWLALQKKLALRRY